MSNKDSNLSIIIQKADLISPSRCDKVGLLFAYVIILPANPEDEEAIRSWNRVRYSHRSVFCDMPQARRLPHGSQNLSV